MLVLKQLFTIIEMRCSIACITKRSNLNLKTRPEQLLAGNTKGVYHCIIGLLFDWFGLGCFANKKNCQLSYIQFQTSQTGGQWYSDTSPFSIPCF
jgi:hypothetical protein